MAQKRPDLARISKRLAASNARVTNFIDGLVPCVDMIVSAAQNENWPEVRRLSEQVATEGNAHGLTELAAAARHVCKEMEGTQNDLGKKRGIIRLISQCGKVRPNEGEALGS